MLKSEGVGKRSGCIPRGRSSCPRSGFSQRGPRNPEEGYTLLLEPSLKISGEPHFVSSTPCGSGFPPIAQPRLPGQEPGSRQARGLLPESRPQPLPTG